MLDVIVKYKTIRTTAWSRLGVGLPLGHMFVVALKELMDVIGNVHGYLIIGHYRDHTTIIRLDVVQRFNSEDAFFRRAGNLLKFV